MYVTFIRQTFVEGRRSVFIVAALLAFSRCKQDSATGSDGTPSGGRGGTSGIEPGEAGRGDGSVAGSQPIAPGGAAGDGGTETELVLKDPTSFEELIDSLGAASCNRIFACLPQHDEEGEAQLMFERRQTCQSYMTRQLYQDGLIRELLARTEDGSLSYDANAGAALMRAWSSCSYIRDRYRFAMSDVLEGNVPVGSPCWIDEECAGDAYCGSSGGGAASSPEPSCPGQCQLKQQHGDACSAGRCSSATGFSACLFDLDQPIPDAGASVFDRDFICRPLPLAPAADIGQPCTTYDYSAESFVPCKDGLWCARVDDELSHQGLCRPPIPPGGPCVDQDDVCAEGTCSPDGVCRAATVVRELGDACRDEDHGIVCSPEQGLHCSDDSVCVASGDGSEGSPCGTGRFRPDCAPGLYCEREQLPDFGGLTNSGICRRLRPAGEPCERDEQCVSYTCDGTCSSRYCSLR